MVVQGQGVHQLLLLQAVRQLLLLYQVVHIVMHFKGYFEYLEEWQALGWPLLVGQFHYCQMCQMSRTASFLPNLSFPLLYLTPDRPSPAYLIYLWTVLVFSRDFHTIPLASVPFHNLPLSSMTFQ